MRGGSVSRIACVCSCTRPLGSRDGAGEGDRRRVAAGRAVSCATNEGRGLPGKARHGERDPLTTAAPHCCEGSGSERAWAKSPSGCLSGSGSSSSSTGGSGRAYLVARATYGAGGCAAIARGSTRYGSGTGEYVSSLDIRGRLRKNREKKKIDKSSRGSSSAGEQGFGRELLRQVVHVPPRGCAAAAIGCVGANRKPEKKEKPEVDEG